MNSQLRIALLLAVTALIALSCGGRDRSPRQGHESNPGSAAKITFLELGSVNCIPCKRMQPVMKSIETRYAGQVKVIFHDVLKDKEPAQKYGVKLIPTQVFLDRDGRELMRHEGFLPEADIDRFLAAQGLTPIQ